MNIVTPEELLAEFRNAHPEIAKLWQQDVTQEDTAAFSEVQQEALSQYHAAEMEIRDILKDLESAARKRACAIEALKCPHHEWVPVVPAGVLAEVECVHCKWRRLKDGAP